MHLTGRVWGEMDQQLFHDIDEPGDGFSGAGEVEEDGAGFFVVEGFER